MATQDRKSGFGSLSEEQYLRLIEEMHKNDVAYKRKNTSVGTRLKSARRRVFDKIRNNWGKLLIGGIMVSSLQMCEMSPQEKEEFKQDYTELRARENSARQRKVKKMVFFSWGKENDEYLANNGLSIEKPYYDEDWSKGRHSTESVITDKDGKEVGWVEIVTRGERLLGVRMYAFDDKDGSAALLALGKKADIFEEYDEMTMKDGEKITEAKDKNFKLWKMKVFHPFMSRSCEKDVK